LRCHPSRQVLLDALDASGTELVTVAVRRVGLGAGGENLYDVYSLSNGTALDGTAYSSW